MILDEVISAAGQHLISLGFSGVVIIGLIVALYRVWLALCAERKRCEDLVDRMYEMSKETATMIERITGR